jgi:hypothetical protein
LSSLMCYQHPIVGQYQPLIKPISKLLTSGGSSVSSNSGAGSSGGDNSGGSSGGDNGGDEGSGLNKVPTRSKRKARLTPLAEIGTEIVKCDDYTFKETACWSTSRISQMGITLESTNKVAIFSTKSLSGTGLSHSHCCRLCIITSFYIP